MSARSRKYAVRGAGSVNTDLQFPIGPRAFLHLSRKLTSASNSYQSAFCSLAGIYETYVIILLLSMHNRLTSVTKTYSFNQHNEIIGSFLFIAR